MGLRLNNRRKPTPNKRPRPTQGLDPQRTAGIRRSFNAEVKRMLGAAASATSRGMPSLAITTNSSSQDVDRFEQWFADLMDRIVLQPSREVISRYVDLSFRTGSGRVFDDFHSGRSKVGEPAGLREGMRKQFIEDLAGHPQTTVTVNAFGFIGRAADKVRTITARVYNDLKSVVQGIVSRGTRVVADAVEKNKEPSQVTRQVLEEVKRGLDGLLVTSGDAVSRGFVAGQIAALRQLGVRSVTPAVEWTVRREVDGTIAKTVCKLCRPLDGLIFTVDEAEGLFPRHPKCQCSLMIPTRYGVGRRIRVDSKDEIEDAIARSRGKAKSQQGWAKDVKISKVRPTRNVFCPTGAGGGVDPSCGKHDGNVIDLPEKEIDELVTKLVKKEYPRIKKNDHGETLVDGRKVVWQVPNQSSIGSSLEDYDVLPGLREVQMDQLMTYRDRRASGEQPPKRAGKEEERLAALTEQIRKNNKISGLIVVEDGHPDGPYVLEGSHRIDALDRVGAKSFPAMVVIDRQSVWDRLNSGETLHKRFNNIFMKERATVNEWSAPPEVVNAYSSIRAAAGLGLNVFCPTGEGGGVDPTCSPAERAKLHDLGISAGGTQRIVMENPSIRDIRQWFRDNPQGDEWAQLKGMVKEGKVFMWDASSPLTHGAVGRYLDRNDHSTVEPEWSSRFGIRMTGGRLEMDDKGNTYRTPKRLAIEPYTSNTPSIDEMGAHLGIPVLNVFCPTGQGGGVDPTCGKTESLRKRGFVLSDVQERWLREGQGTIKEVNIDDLVPRKGEPLEGVAEEVPAKIRSIIKDWEDGYAHDVPQGYVGSDDGKVHVTDGRHRIVAQKVRGETTIPMFVANGSQQQEQSNGHGQ